VWFRISKPIPAVRQDGNRFTGTQRWTTAALSIAGAVVFLLMAFFTERNWGGEERTLYSIPYTYLHEGKLAFPAYGYANPVSYDRLFVHPPTHYQEIAYLMKAGLPLYYAEAVPTVFWAIACLLVIVTAEFSFVAQLGLLCGVMSAGGWVATIGSWDYGFHLRPDAQMAFALLAGFLLLAASQAQRWEVHRFFLGSLVVTYGSTVHYSGWCAWIGILAFLFTSSRELPWREYRVRLIAAILGASLAGIPYLVYHMLPNRDYLRQYSTLVSMARIPETIRQNFPAYRDAAYQFEQRLPQLFYAAPLYEVCAIGIPPFLVAFALLVWRRQTRTLAFSILPLSLFLFAIFERKLWSYFYLECMLVLIGVWLVAAWAWMKLAELLPMNWRKVAGPLLAFLFLLGFGSCTPQLVKVQWKRQQHEFGLLRALAKEIVGPNATIAAIHPLWYLAGGRRWFDLNNDLLVKLPAVDLRTYFSRIDAVAVQNRTFIYPATGINEASLYEQGLLRLSGFLESRLQPSARWLYFSLRHDSPVRGFYWKNGKLFRFQEAPNSRLTLVSIVMSGDVQPFLSALDPLQYWALDLPTTRGQEGSRFVLVMLLDSQRCERGDPLLAGAKLLEVVHGKVDEVDSRSMPAPADEVDPIDVPRSYPELLALIAKSSNAGLRASLELSLYSVNASMDPVPGKAKWLQVTSTRPLSLDWLAKAELPQISNGRYYRISLDLAMEAGGIATQIVQDGNVLQSLYRPIPLGHISESFVVQFKGGSPMELVLSADNTTGKAPVRFQMSEPVLEEVDLPD